MRASRLISLLLLLQTRGRMTAQQLADTLEVSVRTIYRDVDSLSAAGIPLYGDAGPAGGYQLIGGYRTRLTGFTTGEAEALVLAGAPEAAAELGLGAVLAAARLKLSAALPPGLRERAAVVEERFHLDAPNWYSDGDPSPHLTAVAQAVWSQCRIGVVYRRWTAPTDVARTLEPHGIVLKGGRWYLDSGTRFILYHPMKPTLLPGAGRDYVICSVGSATAAEQREASAATAARSSSPPSTRNGNGIAASHS
jgi:predicted DNA-binding transcriptional regulator YafY